MVAAATEQQPMVAAATGIEKQQSMVAAATEQQPMVAAAAIME